MPRVGEWIHLANGQAVHISRSAPKCRFCRRAAELLCDWPDPTRKSRTCDRKLCKRCAVHIAGGKHRCPDHRTEE